LVHVAPRLRAAAASALVVLALLIGTSTVSPVAAASLPAAQFGAIPVQATPATAAARVIARARSHLGARYVWGAKGPRVFDCIGLVLRVYSEAGVLNRIGGWRNASGYALLRWARSHHLVSRTHGQPGDVVVWGGGGHVGIYLGNGMAISALTSGVRIHGVHAVTKRFTAFIHTNLGAISLPGTPAATTANVNVIGTRHAAAGALLRTGHTTQASVFSHPRTGARITVFRIWKDPSGRTWYRVNAATHVGWMLASQTTA
jgi:hypothetical protein